MKKKYIKPETMVICTEPVAICAGSTKTGWNNDSKHQGDVYSDGDSGFNEVNWGENN